MVSPLVPFLRYVKGGHVHRAVALRAEEGVDDDRSVGVHYGVLGAQMGDDVWEQLLQRPRRDLSERTSLAILINMR